MNYYIDTEFLEGAQTRRILGTRLTKFALLAAFVIAFIGFTLIYAGYKEAAMTLGVVSIVLQLFWGLIKQETPPTIDLISIGIVGEDGRELYLISKDFNLKEAWNRYDLKTEQVYGDARNIYPKGITHKVYWIRENVLKPIWKELFLKSEIEWLIISSSKEEHTKAFKEMLDNGHYDHLFTYKSLNRLINKYGKTNKEIAIEATLFIHNMPNREEKFETLEEDFECLKKIRPIKKPQFYGYYADYDWVVFCWLFGKMIDLPKGFPKYCIDLKQMLDLKCELDSILSFGKRTPSECLKNVQEYDHYPKKTNEHNALADARWNMKLHKFIKSL